MTRLMALVLAGLLMVGCGGTDYEDRDADGDGVSNGQDAFPEDASEQSDTDGDGVGDRPIIARPQPTQISRTSTATAPEMRTQLTRPKPTHLIA